MAFVRIKGLDGLLYVPEHDGGAKKHPCEDCFSCQMCSDNRCALCLKAASCTKARQQTPDPSPDPTEDR